jgi:SAM-dependent methyltransferase
MLSDEPAEDLEKFCRYLERNFGKKYLNVTTRVLDLGCGNGRNLIYIVQNYGMRGVGYDISDEAIKIATRASESLPITYTARSIEGIIDLPDQSVDIVLDMMTSHFLREREREVLRSEIVRVLKPGGWLFFKSFLSEEDMHVKRLLKDYPADEKDSYIHPEIGVLEHVWNGESLHEFFSNDFAIEKIERSFKHIRDGKPWKRRTVCAYMQKPF